MASAGRVISFQSVTNSEMEMKEGYNSGGSCVLSHIQVPGNEGTWSKHPKATTELDQIAIGCCLKTTEHTADSSRCTGSNFDVHHHCQTQPMHHFSKRTLCIVV
ncbi:hypothetical protein BKA82DRAFT_4205484 [Pisolithus tinctorius]|nr:hypothetical protein BKA82DRAFT_4205484 [Pisolithus tinctorius]